MWHFSFSEIMPKSFACSVFFRIFATNLNDNMMGKFVNPFTDVGFKRIFGQEVSKPILLAFLNSLLVGERAIVDVKLLDKELLGLAGGDRSLIYDI